MSVQPTDQMQGTTIERQPEAPTEAAGTPPARDKIPAIFGSFWLDGTEFALDASVILEVVGLPEQLSSMPLAPDYMLGLFNLRGTIVPIIDLRRLLGLPDREVTDRKVAIVEDGDVCIGLTIDRTGEVLNIQGAAHVDFRPRDGELKDIVVQGLLKLDDGRRIVQILDPHLLLNLKKVPRAGAVARRNHLLGTAHRGQRFNCITFQFGHTTCAIDLRHVEEVMDAPEINDSMLVHDCFIGVTNLRGQIIPVADARNFMGDRASIKSSEVYPPSRKMLVISTEGGLVGVLVYSIDSIMSCFEDEILQFTKLALPRADLIRGCLVNKSDEIILMLDHEVLKRDRMLVDTALRCREVHPGECKSKAARFEGATGARMTFIVFMIETRSALNSQTVSEIISYPKSLLRPPYALDFVDGIINLRGELITLINPRKVYGLPDIDRTGAKVLIFLHDGRKYGILVDSVDEIVNTTANRVSDKMTIKQGGTQMQIVEDDGGCIQSPAHGPVMVLDTDSFLKRCFKKAGGMSLDAKPVA